MKRVRLAVRKLVEQVMLSGDIDNRYVDASALYEGAKAHRRLQKAAGPFYQSEVSLKLGCEVAGIAVTVFGRADGVIVEDGAVIVDEIKTTSLPLERMERHREAHMAQARCYAHMLLETMDDPPAEVTVQLTYHQLETSETVRRRFDFTREENAAWFEALLMAYSQWLEHERSWQALRDASIKALDFPYSAYRKGQRELAVAAYRAIVSGKRLYAQAPTGIGKTLSVLFPAVKGVAEGVCGKLFYLTAKTVTRAAAEQAAALMAGKGLRFKSVTLRAKDKICFCEETVCNPDACEFARGHYDRVREALLDLLQCGPDIVTPQVTSEFARKHRVCPHELALDAAEWADLVVGDYNHVFDPTVYLRRFFDAEGGADGADGYVFLIDEAHNLDGRVRDMYTAALRKSDFLSLKRALSGKGPLEKRLAKAAADVNAHLLQRRKALEEANERQRADAEQDYALTLLVTAFCERCDEFLAEHRDHSAHGEVLALYFEALHYAAMSEGYGAHYAAITESFGSELVYTLYCLDPSDIIAQRLRLAKAAVLFSATLTPLAYYRDILGGDGDDGLLSLPSPFEPERLLLCAHTGISTRYADRENSVPAIVAAIACATGRKRGNYLVFFPSYEYMRAVHEAFVAAHPAVEAMMQDTHMSEDERAAFLQRFDDDNQRTLLGFCVLGGIFSEGIDLVGERLIGTVIVGVGLPKLTLRSDLIKQHFNEKNGAGFDYAYTFPGMNKVLQAAGRVIRSEEDYGAVVLLDSRFSTPRYKALFPPHWAHLQYVRDGRALLARIEGFEHFNQ